MSKDPEPTRRGFMKICLSAVTLVTASPRVLAGRNAVHRYPPARLIDPQNHPVALDRLTVGETYVFHYPHVSTPCFLIDLGRPVEADTTLHTENGETYHWPGGIGPNRSVVAFSAICAHRMSHPAREVSFINYRHEPVVFSDSGHQRVERSQVIYCCSERSVYDPLQGARVLGGPAKQPLAAIVLEQAADGSVSAVATCGGELFARFFREFGERLVLEYRTRNIERLVSDTTTVMPIGEFSQNQMLCSSQA